MVVTIEITALFTEHLFQAGPVPSVSAALLISFNLIWGSLCSQLAVCLQVTQRQLAILFLSGNNSSYSCRMD